MYTIGYEGQSFRKLRDFAMTLRGAKCLATQRLEHGMSAVIYNCQDEAIYIKEFWLSLDTFGWHKWREI